MTSTLKKIKIVIGVLFISLVVRFIFLKELDISLQVRIITWVGSIFYIFYILVDLPAQKKMITFILDNKYNEDIKSNIRNYIKELLKLILLLGILFTGIASDSWFDISEILFNITICAIFLTLWELIRLVTIAIFVEKNLFK
jgi:hypothetical protein